MFTGFIDALKAIPATVRELPPEDKFLGVLVILLAATAVALGLGLSESSDRTLAIAIPLSGLVFIAVARLAVGVIANRRKVGANIDDKSRKILDGWWWQLVIPPDDETIRMAVSFLKIQLSTGTKNHIMRAKKWKHCPECEEEPWQPLSSWHGIAVGIQISGEAVNTRTILKGTKRMRGDEPYEGVEYLRFDADGEGYGWYKLVDLEIENSTGDADYRCDQKYRVQMIRASEEDVEIMNGADQAEIIRKVADFCETNYPGAVKRDRQRLERSLYP